MVPVCVLGPHRLHLSDTLPPSIPPAENVCVIPGPWQQPGGSWGRLTLSFYYL